MKFALENPADLRIHAYESGAITLAVPRDLRLEELSVDPETGLCTLQAGFILGARQLQTDWEPRALPDLTAAHLTAVLELEPEILLLGTGDRLQFPAPDILAPVHRAGVGLEVMDTAAACRTFNILVGEGRRVVAALLMI